MKRTFLTPTLGEKVHGEESKTVTIGTSNGVSVTLAPNQAVEASLTVSRDVMKSVYNTRFF